VDELGEDLMGDTEISWTHRPGTRGRTWNPTQGCAIKSEGCRNCYAMRQARRFAGPGRPFHGLVNLKTGKWTGKARLATHKLDEPFSWREASTVFVDSMSDLFYEGFTFEEIAAVFGVMALCPQHTFQILTKRPDRMNEWFQWAEREARDANAGVGMTISAFCVCMADKRMDAERGRLSHAVGELIAKPWPAWPLRNVWLGTSVENQAAADERIPALLETPAVVRFLSCEPLLEPVNITEYFDPCSVPCGEEPWPELSWVIAGCESGPGARKCDVEWLRSVRDQCAAANVPYFLKQAEESTDCGEDRNLDIGDDDTVAFGDGSRMKPRRPGGHHVIEAPYLDGEQHLAFPVTA